MQQRPPLLTVAQLKEHLSVFDDDALVDFSGLDFYRTKLRGEKLVNIEFNQQVYRNPQGDVVVQNLE